MKKLQLNTAKIKKELERLNKNQTWLAAKMETTRQNLSSLLIKKSPMAAEKIGHVLNIEPKDLIK